MLGDDIQLWRLGDGAKKGFYAATDAQNSESGIHCMQLRSPGLRHRNEPGLGRVLPLLLRNPGLASSASSSPFGRRIHPIGMEGRLLAPLMIVGLLLAGSCGPRESDTQRHQDANTPAGKVGQAAHRAAVEADKAAAAVGRKLDKAAHDAHEGWKEDARKARDKR